MPLHVPRHFTRVFVDCRRTLGMTQRGLAEALGVSRRTIIRWQMNQSFPAPFQVRELAALTREHDEDLADEVLSAAGLDADLAPQSAPPDSAAVPAGSAGSPGPVTPAPPHLVDSLVCVAADAANVVPRAMRPALRAAFRRAEELGLTVASITLALAEEPPRVD